MDTPETLWTELSARVRAYIGRRVRDAHTADDITQDVLLKVQAKRGDLPPVERLPAWVSAVARNAVIDYYRSAALRRHAPVDPDAHVADTEAPDRAEAIRDLAPCLAAMVNRLSEPYRTALRLADIEGVEQQSLADRTGVSLSGAKSRVQRARAQLRDMLQDCCHIVRDRRGGVVDYQTTDRTAGYCGGPRRGTCGQEK